MAPGNKLTPAGAGAIDVIRSQMPVKARPFDHQARAFAFAMKLFDAGNPGAAFLMEMGTGKSLSAIAVMGRLWLSHKITRALVVAPLSILGVWTDELSKFADFEYTATVLTGTKEKKIRQLEEVSGGGLQIVITNYETAWRIADELIAFHADIVIADEGHKLKDNRSRQSKGMQKIGDSARYKLLLTGTIISGNEIDVFSPYRYLDKRIFGTSFYAFRGRYFDMRGYGNHTPVFRDRMSEEFLKKLHSIAFRTTKAECLDLPPITDEIRNVDLEPRARKLYDEIMKESYASLGSSEVTTANILTRILRLSQLTGGFLTDDEGKVTPVSTAKLDALEDIIDSMQADRRKLVIMARFVAEIDAIEALLTKKGIGYACIRGGTKDRPEEIRRFQLEDDCTVFLGQIQAAGLGITLTAASTLVFYSLDYSMSNYDQARSRIHRAGQTQPCTYISLSCRGTIDRKVIHALNHKMDLARMLVDDWRRGINPFEEKE